MAVVQADQREAAAARLPDRDLRRLVHGVIADVVAAVDHGGDFGFVHDGRRAARLARARVLGNGEDARQAREAIAAQRGVDEMGSDDARFVRGEAGAHERGVGQRFGLRDGEPDRVGAIGVEQRAHARSRSA